MTSYKVPNDNNVFVSVTDADLDNALASNNTSPLPAHLSHAAAAAKRKDSIPRLRQTLTSPIRRQKRAAALALLALNDQEAAPLLESLTSTEKDAFIMRMFKLIALRLRSVDLLMQQFMREDDPQTSELVLSIYNSYLSIDDSDASFLVEALEKYLEKSLKWIRKAKSAEWESDIGVLLTALSSASGLLTMQQPYMAVTRAKACSLLRKLLSMDLDESIEADARTLLEQWEQPSA